MTQYPDPADIDTPYNAGSGQVPLDYSEVADVLSATKEAISDYLDVNGYPALTPHHTRTFSEYLVSEVEDSRTIWVELDDPRFVTTGLVSQLQSDVLARYPLWRVRLHGSGPDGSHDDDVVVYPTEVHAGACWRESDIDKAIDNIRGTLTERYESYHSSLWDRIGVVKQELTTRAATLDVEPFVVVACFSLHDRDWQELWVAFAGSESDFRVVIPMHESSDNGDASEAISCDGEFPIVGGNKIGVARSEWTDGRGLHQYSMPMLAEQNLLVQKLATDLLPDDPGFVEQEWPIQIRFDECIDCHGQ